MEKYSGRYGECRLYNLIIEERDFICWFKIESSLEGRSVPLKLLTVLHLLFLAFIVLNVHHEVLFMGAFLPFPRARTSNPSLSKRI